MNKNKFLYDKLRFAKRSTTKREFNFIPIKHGLPESTIGLQNKEIVEGEQIFDLAPPKWASSPRDTPGGPQKKRRFHVDISLIEPVPGTSKVSRSEREQEDPSLNLAAPIPHTTEVEIQKRKLKEKKVTTQEVTTQEVHPGENRNVKESEKSAEVLTDIQNQEKKVDSEVVKELKEKKELRKSEKSSGNDSEGSNKTRVPQLKAKKRRSESGSSNKTESSSKSPTVASNKNLNRKTQRKGSSRSKGSQRPNSGENQSSGKGESENDFPRISRSRSMASKESGGSASEGRSSSRNRSASEKAALEEKRSRRLSRGSSNEDGPPLRVRRPSQKSSGSESRPEVDGVPLTRKSLAQVRKESEMSAGTMSATRTSKRKSTGSDKTGNKTSSKIRKSSESGKSSANELADFIEGSVPRNPKRSQNSESAEIKIKNRTRKLSGRSSQSDKSEGEGLTTKNKLVTSPRKLEKPASQKDKKSLPSAKSANPRSSRLERTSGQKSTLRSNRKVEMSSTVSKSSVSLEKKDEAVPSTSRTSQPVVPDPELSAEEAQAETEKKSFQNNPKSSKRLMVDHKDSSSDDQLFYPQKTNILKQESLQKGAKFKKSLSEGSKGAGDVFSDEELFHPQKSLVTYPANPKSTSKLAQGLKSASRGTLSSVKTLPALPHQQKFQMSNSDSEENKDQIKLGKKPKKSLKSNENISDEIPLQNKPLITTFAGLPLTEKGSSDTELSGNEKNEILEESLNQIESILNTDPVKLDSIYNRNKELKLNLLQNSSEVLSKQQQNSVTYLDILWNFLRRSLHVIIKETEDVNKKSLIKTMKSFMEEQFIHSKNEEMKKIEMHNNLKNKSHKIQLLTNKLLYLKQKNRQLAQQIFEKEEKKQFQKEEEILERFENYCQKFAEFKRS